MILSFKQCLDFSQTIEAEISERLAALESDAIVVGPVLKYVGMVLIAHARIRSTDTLHARASAHKKCVQQV